MDAFSLAIGNLSSRKSLDEEILDILRNASRAMTSAEILSAITVPPDRETLTRMVFELKTKKLIEKVADVPAPAGTPRATVAAYRIANTKPITAASELIEAQPSPREQYAQLKAKELSVTKVIPARFRGRQDQIIGLLAEHNQPLTIEDLAKKLSDASLSAIKQAVIKAKNAGKITSICINRDGARLRAFSLPGSTVPDVTSHHNTTNAEPTRSKTTKQNKLPAISIDQDGAITIATDGTTLNLNPAQTLALGDFMHLSEKIWRP